MIPNIECKPAESLSAHIGQMIDSACGPAAPDAVTVRETAAVVAEVCEAGFPGGDIPSDYLALLVARSLWAVGESGAAEIFIREQCPEDVQRACIPFDRRPEEMNRIWRMCAGRALRSSNWSTRSGGALWVLDLSRIDWSRSFGMELAMRRGLMELIRPLAPVWDPTSGRGGLGLLGLEDQAGRLMNRSPKSRKLKPVVSEMRGLCEDVLRDMAASRGWQDRPEIVELSL